MCHITCARICSIQVGCCNHKRYNSHSTDDFIKDMQVIIPSWTVVLELV